MPSKFTKHIGQVLAETIVRLVENDKPTKPFHDVLRDAGYTLKSSRPNVDTFTHPSKPKVGIMSGKAIGTSALSLGKKMDTHHALKAHLDALKEGVMVEAKSLPCAVCNSEVPVGAKEPCSNCKATYDQQRHMSRLHIKAFKAFPSSPTQKAIQKETAAFRDNIMKNKKD